jgi:hypothetical protein
LEDPTKANEEDERKANAAEGHGVKVHKKILTCEDAQKQN